MVSSPASGSPWFVAITTFSSSGTAPMTLTARISTTSSTDIISPRRIISGLRRLIKRSIWRISAASKSPMIRSASRMAETSGVVTTIALAAPAMALRNPCSMPAGQSNKTKSNCSPSSSVSLIICSGVTADLSLVCAEGRRKSSENRLSRISACFSLQFPSTTSTRL